MPEAKAKATYIPKMKIRVYRAKTGKWEKIREIK